MEGMGTGIRQRGYLNGDDGIRLFRAETPNRKPTLPMQKQREQ